MRRHLVSFAANADGSAALEYGLIAAGIAIAFLAAFVPFGGEMGELADVVRAGITTIRAFPAL
jgi:Flp pilus assembly pilin Flp